MLITIKDAQQLAQKTLFKELELLCASLERPSHNTQYHMLDRKGRLELVQSIYTTLALVESYSGGSGKVGVASSKEWLLQELKCLCLKWSMSADYKVSHILDDLRRLLKQDQARHEMLPQVDTYSEGHVHYCAHPDCPGRTHEPPHDECHEGSVL